MSDAVHPFAEAGVGVWRDGDRVVLHREATFPPYCIVTGEPTDSQCTIELTWNEADRYFVQRRKLGVPLSAQHVRRFRQQLGSAMASFYLCLGLTLLLVTVALSAAVLDAGTGEWVAALGFVCIPLLVVTMVLMAWAERCRARLIKYSKAEAGYLWLQGPGPQFRERLPHWPYRG